MCSGGWFYDSGVSDPHSPPGPAPGARPEPSTSVPGSGVVSPEPGTPFDMLARTPAHRWWRPALTVPVFAVTAAVSMVVVTVLFAGTVLVTMPVRVLGVMVEPELGPRHLLDPLWVLFFGFVVLVALLPPAVLAARWPQRRSPMGLFSVSGAPRTRWFGAVLWRGLLVFGVTFGLGLLLGVLAGAPPGGDFPGWWAYSSIVLIAVLVVPLQSATEEVVFRGLLLQTVNAWLRVPWPGIVLSSLVFLSGHGYTDPLVWGQLLLMAVVMCWLSIRTGGLEAAIALHVSNNALSLVVGGLYGVPGLEQSGNYPLVQVLPLAVAVLVYAWLVDREAERRRVATVVGGRVPIHPLTLRPCRASRAEAPPS
ncbi:CPBP family intramembrane metalloprotease domain-containing protein [Actinopolyspora mortivallis]|uniref:CPBP family intramembrane metalloprotease domain-containing protein n=1 Tax=Actinopolyspora mortivallis TaxID=33906 RepID=A0A2T0H0D5_ACTMO|nr:CPBP family intramembrane metalloprotease domain-containing protein [Actinopolyspora mortivallis]